MATFLFVLLAFLWLPTRLVQEANPEWRMVSWFLALEVIGLTLTALYLGLGKDWTAQLAVPIGFFLVAVPWPAFLEGPLIQNLTSNCASLTVEVMSWLGIPAVQHGNVIEVGTGLVGIDEACSGIRSFQSSIMLSLFLGELFWLKLTRRIFLVLAGFLVSFAFNVCRTSFLTWVAANKGVAAIARFHDPAGIAILIACTFALWLLALFLKGRQRAEKPPAIPCSRSRLWNPPQLSQRRLALGLLLWLVVAAAGVELWYRSHEWGVPMSASWTVEWPRHNPTFSELPMAERAKWLLRYDEEVTASWKEADGTQWQMIYLRWLPGRVARHLAKSHTPEICLTASGHSVGTLPDLSYLPVHGLRLPFRKYIVNDGNGPVYVFYCLWEDRSQEQSFKTEMLTYGSRLAPVLAGRRNCGQRSLEIVVGGVQDGEEAQRAVVRELEKLLKVSEPSERRGPA